MKLVSVLLAVAVSGCSVVPYHSEFTRSGAKADYKADREQCREVSKQRAATDAYGETAGAVWWQAVQKHMVECMNGKGYEWVKKE